MVLKEKKFIENSGNGKDLNKIEGKSNGSEEKIEENEINLNEGLNNSTNNNQNLEAGQEREENKSSDSSFITGKFIWGLWGTILYK